MPLPIKTAVHTDGRTVRAVLVTPSLNTLDVGNLVGADSGADCAVTCVSDPYSATYMHVAFNHTADGRVRRYDAGTTVPGYLLWDGRALRAVTPRVFAQDYVVVAQVTPAPRVSHHHG